MAFLKRHRYFILTVLITILALQTAKWLGYREGYRDAGQEVARATRLLLLENCQAFNRDLAAQGKSERMDCSLFSGLSIA